MRLEYFQLIDRIIDLNLTDLTIRVDYRLPGSVLGQLLNKLVIEQKNEADLRDGLENLKVIAESEN